MAIALKLSDDLVEDAKPIAAAEYWSAPKQIEYGGRIGKACLENPDLLLRFIQDTLLSRKEAKAGQWVAGIKPFKAIQFSNLYYEDAAHAYFTSTPR